MSLTSSLGHSLGAIGRIRSADPATLARKLASRRMTERGREVTWLTRPINPVFKDLAVLALKIVTIAAAFTLVFTVVYGFDRNTDPGMAPTVKDGDLVLMYKFAGNYKADDLVVLNYQGKQEVRRVVAVGGDIVNITADGLVVNGSLQQEPDVTQPTRRYADGIDFPVRVGYGQVFLLGDARQDATDSRVYGPVGISDISGKVITLLRWRSF